MATSFLSGDVVRQLSKEAVMASTRKAVGLSMLLGLVVGSALPIAVAESPHPTQVVTVLKVNNGQEVLVEINGEGRAVRLACLQAPLHQQQPWSDKAKAALSKALPQGSTVQMELRARDVYGRVVARLLKEKTDIAAPLISRGRVFAYDGYLGRCDDLNYQKLQREAQRRKVGLWAMHGGIARPWDLIETSGEQGQP
ncbi:thermonuclease family protein [Synechococcus sp. AH-601-N10]|nr:thermonuclease family protein [Synechococcus sp. AH-601-N10]